MAHGYAMGVSDYQVKLDQEQFWNVSGRAQRSRTNSAGTAK